MVYCRKFFTFIILSSLILAGVSSCEKFEGNQTIPSFLQIDSLSLSTDYITQGTTSHAITDAWVYVDDNYLGTFQLPARFPVLKEGNHKVTILGGIRKNGISATRAYYPFYKPVEKTINFSKDSVVDIDVINTTYQETAIFLIKEDFDMISVLLDTTTRSDVEIEMTTEQYTFEGAHSGMIILDSNQFFECMSHDPMDIPRAPVYLEMNFKTNNTLSVGVIVYTSFLLYQANIVTLVDSKGAWKKIYVDMTNMLNTYAGAEKFRLTLGTFKDSNVDQAKIFIDNVKVVTFGSSD